MSSVDWDTLMKQAGAGFEPVPDDIYDVTVQSAEAVTSQNGRPMIKCTMVIEGGPYAGKKLFNNFVLTLENPDALSFFFQHMNALGIDKTFFSQLGGSIESTLPTVAGALVNRRCRVQTTQRSWQGQMRNNVAGVMPPLAGVAGGPLGGQAPAMAPLGGQPAAQPLSQPAPQPAPVAQPAPQPAPQPQPAPAVPAAPFAQEQPAPAPTPQGPYYEQPQPAPVPAAPAPPVDAQAAAAQAAAEAQAIAAQQAAQAQAQPQPAPAPQPEADQPPAAPAPPF